MRCLACLVDCVSLETLFRRNHMLIYLNYRGGNWPYQGEIDILEGVHDNVHNQVTFHTADSKFQHSPQHSFSLALILDLLPVRLQSRYSHCRNSWFPKLHWWHISKYCAFHGVPCLTRTRSPPLDNGLLCLCRFECWMCSHRSFCCLVWDAVQRPRRRRVRYVVA